MAITATFRIPLYIDSRGYRVTSSSFPLASVILLRIDNADNDRYSSQNYTAQSRSGTQFDRCLLKVVSYVPDYSRLIDHEHREPTIFSGDDLSIPGIKPVADELDSYNRRPLFRSRCGFNRSRCRCKGQHRNYIYWSH